MTRDKELIALVRGAFSSTKVIGRRRIAVDPREVRESKEFKDAIRMVKQLRAGEPITAVENLSKNNKHWPDMP